MLQCHNTIDLSSIQSRLMMTTEKVLLCKSGFDTWHKSQWLSPFCFYKKTVSCWILSFVFVQKNGSCYTVWWLLNHRIGHKLIDLYSAVMALLSSNSINVDNWRGQLNYSSSNMPGVYNSLQTRIQDENPKALFVPFRIFP